MTRTCSMDASSCNQFTCVDAVPRPCTQLCVIGKQCNPQTGQCEAFTCAASDACPSGKTCQSANKTCTGGRFCPQFDCVDACTSDKQFLNCGSACPATCRNPNPVCTEQCVRGCFCKNSNFLLTDDGRCVNRNQCPSTSGSSTSGSGCRGAGQRCGRRNDSACPTGTACVDDTTDNCVPSASNFCPGTCRCL
jgi:hypothetical protein